MSRYRTMFLMLFAVFALSAVVVSSASAAEGLEWLVSGAAVTAAAPVEGDALGELLLEDMKAADILCSGLLVVLYQAEGFDLVLSAEGLEGRKEKILCSFITAGACESGMAPEVTPINLPWLTELVLDTPTLIVDLIKEDEGHGPPGYLVECLVLGINVDDACTGESGADVTNNAGAGDVEALFSQTEELVTPAGGCTIGGAKEGLVGSDEVNGVAVPSLLTTVGGLSLAISGDGL